MKEQLDKVLQGLQQASGDLSSSLTALQRKFPIWQKEANETEEGEQKKSKEEKGTTAVAESYESS